jgi:hypothetical protein
MYKKGKICTDIEQDSEVVVLRVIPDRCDKVVVKEGRYSEQTVYDYNSRYSYVSKSDPVVVAVYSGSLPTDPSSLSPDGRCTIANNSDSKKYKFPISRIEPIN